MIKNRTPLGVYNIDPALLRVITAAANETDLIVLVGFRSRAAQETAFKNGFSKAHFGDSAHNYSPALAADVAPFPLDWKNQASFVTLKETMFRAAIRLNIELTWGGDWENQGTIGAHAPVDLDHFELRNWRALAKQRGIPK